MASWGKRSCGNRSFGTGITLTGVALALALASGCATMTQSNQQVVVVRTILEHREIGGVGCVLTNQAGRWFVTSPGRVTIRKSAGDLSVDCAQGGTGSGRDVVASRFNTGSLAGNIVVSAGLGYYVDRRSGAGFDYPATLTILMRGALTHDARLTDPAGPAGNLFY